MPLIVRSERVQWRWHALFAHAEPMSSALLVGLVGRDGGKLKVTRSRGRCGHWQHAWLCIVLIALSPISLCTGVLQTGNWLFVLSVGPMSDHQSLHCTSDSSSCPSATDHFAMLTSFHESTTTPTCPTSVHLSVLANTFSRANLPVRCARFSVAKQLNSYRIEQRQQQQKLSTKIASIAVR